jgi:DNA polymerase elongation subunit (family B)
MSDGSRDKEILYGVNQRAGLVGLASNASGVKTWWRKGSELTSEQQEFRPFFLVSHPHLLDSYKPEVRIEQLAGENLYSHRVDCDDWQHYESALKHVIGFYRKNRSDFEYEPFLRFSDPVNQYLLASGCTHYKALDVTDLNVVFVAMRAIASDGADYADPRLDKDRIVMIALSDGRDYIRVFQLENGEKALIEEFSSELVKLDPDVIVGHELFKGSIDYIYQRARRQRLKLGWGRDGSFVTSRKSRAPAAEKQLEYPRADVAGRSLIDTWFLAQYFDIVKRDLARYDANYVARYLDAACQLPDGLPTWEIERAWTSKPQLLVADIKYELEAAGSIYHTLVGSYFVQAQILPLSFQDCIFRGNGVKINNLLMREYLRRSESIPEPAEARTFVGGYTELRQTGLIHNVLNVDVASLYPSIMLSHDVKPASDTGNVFQPLLRELTEQRLAAKQAARATDDPHEQTRADALQGALKVFINSFFGYLGTNRMHWADPLKAEFITTTGQQVVQLLSQLVAEEGGQVIEIDTDGVYFRAPAGCDSAADRAALVKRIGGKLPEGINIELGGYFPAMLSYKIKNYALLDEEGQVAIKGSGLRSRGLEPYLYNFIAYSLAAILHEHAELIDQRYHDLSRMIEQRTINIRELAKTETLIESLDSYSDKVAAGKRNRAAAYEVALRARRHLRPGDQVSYYITGEKATVKAYETARSLREYDSANPDYNIQYYLKKLQSNYKKTQDYGNFAGDADAEV